MKEALRAERLAVRVYHYQSGRVKDRDLALLLKSIAATEAYHASILAELIKGMGASLDDVPTTDDSVVMELVDSLETDEDIIRLNIILEQKALNGYAEDALLVEDERVARILERIGEDEREHLERFYTMLSVLRSREGDEEGPLVVFQRVVDAGLRRLSRPWLEMFISGVIGSIHVTFGAVAMAAAAGVFHGLVGRLVGAVFFPVGFILLKLSHSELFTENFLVPVAPVIETGRGLKNLLKLWLLTLAGNLLGAVVFAILVLIGGKGVLGALPVEHLRELAAFKLARPFSETLISALFAGAIITTMTWLVVSAETEMGKLVAVWCCIFVMAIGGFTHVVVSTSEVLLGAVYGAHVTFEQWLDRLFIPATIGNTAGGVLLIALLHYLQVLHTKRELVHYLKRRDEILELAVREKLRL